MRVALRRRSYLWIVAITLVVLAFNLMADVLRDAFSREVYVTAGGIVT